MELLHKVLWLLSSEGILHVVNVWGLLGICLVIFAETGIFPILPGDSLLVVAGLAAATLTAEGAPVLNLWTLLLAVPVCAIIGDQVGYSVGRFIGWAIFDWKEKRLGPIPIFKPEWLKGTEAFYERWGVYTVVACRWVPIVRTFAPILAGASKMKYRSFIPYNILGAFSWVWSMVGLGYGLKVGLQAVIERFVPGFDIVKHIDKIALMVIVLSLMPIVLSVLNRRKHAQSNPLPAKARPKRGPKPTKDRRKKK
jgi:membrane-associated protein